MAQHAPWHVLGAGSLGTVWACRLAKAAVPVQLLLRDQASLERYQQGPGLRLVDGDTEQAVQVPADTVAGSGPVSQLWVTCKAYDVEAAISQVRPRLVPGARVVVLQNGLGSQQAVVAALPAAQVYFASTTEGAFRRSDGAVVRAGDGDTWLGDPRAAGSDSTAAPAWSTALVRAGATHRWAPDIMARLWRKLAINCAINPLTVLLGCRNGELGAHLERVAVLCEELCAVLTAAGQASAASGLLAEVEAVIAATAANYSSMYQDVAAGRRTEVTYLLGYVSEQAQRYDVPAPNLNALHQALVTILHRNGLPTT